MSQYPPPDSTFGSTNAPHAAPTGMAGTSAQATTVDSQYSERSRDDARNLTTGGSTGYPVHFSSEGENDSWAQDAQDDWIPGFGAMDPQTRRDALNHHLLTPKFTYEGIVRAYWQQQSQNMVDAQKKAAEKEAMEREMRLRAEQQQRQLGSQQSRRF